MGEKEIFFLALVPPVAVVSRSRRPALAERSMSVLHLSENENALELAPMGAAPTARGRRARGPFSPAETPTPSRDSAQGRQPNPPAPSRTGKDAPAFRSGSQFPCAPRIRSP